MRQTQRQVLFGFFAIILAVLLFRNYLLGSQWVIDASLSLAFVGFMYCLNRYLKMDWDDIVLLFGALLLHNLGAFGFYEFTYLTFGYDNLVHLVSAFAAAYISFNFIARKLHIKKNKRLEDSIIDEHIVILLFLVMASVAMLGTFIELLEFGGAYVLGEGEGILLVGSGDDAQRQYFDTMTDIVVNTVGAIFGTLAYYYLQYRRKPWLR